MTDIKVRHDWLFMRIPDREPTVNDARVCLSCGTQWLQGAEPQGCRSDIKARLLALIEECQHDWFVETDDINRIATDARDALATIEALEAENVRLREIGQVDEQRYW